MKDILKDVAELAKLNLSQDRHLTPVIMWFKEGRMAFPPQMMHDFPDCNEYDNKTRNVWAAGVLAHKLHADFLILVWDAAFRTVSNPEEYTHATEAPLLYPKTMRTECIVVEGISLPSGTEDTTMIPYKGGEDEPVEFLPNDLPEGAAFKSRFADIAVDGWNQAPTL